MAEKPSYEYLEQRVRELEKEVLDLRHAKQASGETDENVYSFLDELRDGFFVTDSRGIITYVNKTLGDIFDYENPREEAGKHFTEFLSPEVVAEMTEKFNRSISDKDYSEVIEFPAIRKDGTTAFLQMNHRPLIEGGKIVGTKGIVRDITANKRAEKALVESEGRVRALLDAITESVSLLDLNGTIQALNKTAAHRFGGTVEKLTGTCIWDLMPPDLSRVRKGKLDEVIESGTPARSVSEREGEIYDANLYPVLNRDGKVTSLAIFARQMTEQTRALEALSESEERYRILFEDNQLSMLLIDPDSDDIVDVNPAACIFYGYSKEELTSKKITDINILPHEQVRELLKGVKHQAQRHFFLPHRLANGDIRNVESFIGPITLNGKQLLYSMIVDVTDRIRAEKALMESEGRLRALLNAITETAILVDPEGTIQAINTTGAQRFGGTAESLTGTCLWDYIPQHLTDVRKSRLENAVKSGAPVRFEHEREGESYNTSLYPMFDSGGKIKTFAYFSMQITKQKKALESLCESEERYRSLFEDNHSIMMLIDPDTDDIADANPVACSFYGYSKEELTRKKITDINVLPREKIHQQINELGYRTHKNFFFPHRLANGEIRTVESFIGPITLNGKEYIYTMVYDVTDRIRAEEALRESGERIRALLNAITESAILADLEGYIQAINETAARRFGGTAEKLTGRCLWDLMPPPAVNLRKAKHDEAIQSRAPVRFEAEREGEFYDSNLNPIFDGDGKVTSLAIFSEQITEQKRALEALRESEKKSRLLIDSMNDGLVMLDKNDSITYVNDRLLDMIGYKRDEVIGKNPKHFCDETSLKFSLEQIAERRKGKKGFYETSWNKKHGGQVPTIKSASPIIDDNGQYEGSFAVIIDITEMKKIEHALRQSEKELKAKTHNLEEVNAALRVLLEQREKDKSEIEQKLLFNVNELVLPYLVRLKDSSLDTSQNAYIGILESNLNDIISPFSRTLSSKYASLTPTEIQVANLIKQGNTTKEIANSFHISSKTIEDHRKNIRKKLKITNRKTNLRTHLSSMQ